MFEDHFDRPDGLVTNEYTFWTSGDPSAVRSPDWDMTSGSLFIQGRSGWTGVPDDRAVDRLSKAGTNSSVFRLNTKRADFRNVVVTFQLLNQGLSSTASTPVVDWDGVHVWLRYQSEYNLYYASINRRDNTVIIKKKVAGGPSNGGTYFPLSAAVPHRVVYGQWVTVSATAQNNADGSVTIALYENGKLLVSAIDNGTIGGPPITASGSVGIRGDNANVKFNDFRVESLDSFSPGPGTGPVVSAAEPEIRVFPNPWRASGHSSAVTFDRLAEDSVVKIFTVAGHEVRELHAVAGQALWDLRNDSASRVASGLYLYSISAPGRPNRRGTIAVVR